MAYSSDNEFDDELPDIQLLLEQKISKSKGKAATAVELLPPSLFDPATPPKPKPKPKPKSNLKSTKVDPASKPKIAGKKKVKTLVNDSASQAPEEAKAKKVTTREKQASETTEKTVIGKKALVGTEGGRFVSYPEVPTSALSDFASTAEYTEKTSQPTPRRRRLVQKKYLPSDESEDDDEEERQETLKKRFADLTSSDSEELPPVHQSKAQTDPTIPGDDDFESHGSRSTLDDVCGAILTYSPPRSSKPRKTIAPTSRTNGAPNSTTGRKLSSPKKKALQIPPSQHRLSSDAFWDQDATNNWIDAYTPYKIPGVVRGLSKTDDILENGSENEEKSTKRTNSKARPREPEEKQESKKAFNSRKKELSEEFLKIVDVKISGGEVARKTASTGGVKIVWSKTLRTTAGTARWKMEKLQVSSGHVDLGDPLAADRVRHHATIELSEKVVDSQEKLYNVICHEYCHLANYMISNVQKPAHGASFKKWAALCTRTFADLSVHVTTTHSYEIDAKYKWACQNPSCGYVYKRHSQSIDVIRHTCGACKGGKLVQTHPPPKEKRPITGYQAFMKENFGRIKAENPGTPQREVMKIVAQAYRETKSSNDLEKAKFVEVGENEGELEGMFGGLKV